jgi:hypothetical protein
MEISSKMCKKRISSILLPKKSSIPSFPVLDLEKKVAENPVFSMKNVAEKLVNSSIDR